MKFAVVGGDMRQAKLAELLAADGHFVSAFAIDKIQLSHGVMQTESAKEAVLEAECVILPLPVTTKEGVLNTPLSSSLHTTNEVFSLVQGTQLVCAGRLDPHTAALAEKKGVEVIDYFAREELAVSNAVATAEGAVQLIMEEMPVTVCGARCLVIGFGRIGKILAHRLAGLQAHVTASARKYADIAWIKAYGYKAAATAELSGNLSNYDIVINTVPSRILGERELKELKPGCLCLDLASKPGGMDFAAASKLGVKAVWALGLPGEVAPVTSGAIIRDTIYNILREREVHV